MGKDIVRLSNRQPREVKLPTEAFTGERKVSPGNFEVEVDHGYYRGERSNITEKVSYGVLGSIMGSVFGPTIIYMGAMLTSYAQIAATSPHHVLATGWAVSAQPWFEIPAAVLVTGALATRGAVTGSLRRLRALDQHTTRDLTAWFTAQKIIVDPDQIAKLARQVNRRQRVPGLEDMAFTAANGRPYVLLRNTLAGQNALTLKPASEIAGKDMDEVRRMLIQEHLGLTTFTADGTSLGKLDGNLLGAARALLTRIQQLRRPGLTTEQGYVLDRAETDLTSLVKLHDELVAVTKLTSQDRERMAEMVARLDGELDQVEQTAVAGVRERLAVQHAYMADREKPGLTVR